jgi:hypothetical protein
MEGEVGEIVTFDGSGSTDPDGNITCYQWQLASDNADDPLAPNPEIIQGVGASGLTRTFSNEQTMSVTLLVSDREDIPCVNVDPMNPGNTPETEDKFSPLAFRTNYSIVCRNTAPTAIIAGAEERTFTGSASTFTNVDLNGSLSSDPETAIDRYVWTCGNDQAPVPVAPDNSEVICRYRLGTFTATLNVVDRGTGVIDPGTGTWACQKSSETDSVIIHVEAPAQ